MGVASAGHQHLVGEVVGRAEAVGGDADGLLEDVRQPLDAARLDDGVVEDGHVGPTVERPGDDGGRRADEADALVL